MTRLGDHIRKKGRVPEETKTDPWWHDGNIILISSDNYAFKYFRYLLVLKAPVLADKLNLHNLCDDNVELVDDLPFFELPDKAWDLSCLLKGLLGDEEIPVSLESTETAEFLGSALRLSTEYQISTLRRRALRVLESRYPSTLSAWDRIHHSEDGTKPFKPSSTAVLVNLAMETMAFSFLPAAMAELVNEVMNGEVFGVPLQRALLGPHAQHEMGVKLHSHAQHGFARMMEHNHVSILEMIKFVRAIGEDCTRPPEMVPSVAGKAPVGAKVLKPRPSTCRSEFVEIAKRLLEKEVLDRPMGYDDFVVDVVEKVRQDRTRTCRKCWKEFRFGVQQRREEWWNAVPGVLEFSGWGDSRLAQVGAEEDGVLI